jgi:hypothetical protein
VADAGSGGKGGKVPGPHLVEKAIYPSVDLALKNVYKLFLLLLGVGPRASISWGQSNQVYADLEKTRGFA